MNYIIFSTIFDIQTGSTDKGHRHVDIKYIDRKNV